MVIQSKNKFFLIIYLQNIIWIVFEILLSCLPSNDLTNLLANTKYFVEICVGKNISTKYFVFASKYVKLFDGKQLNKISKIIQNIFCK